ncbi:hypothetical protein FJZ19_05840 [Candidatus Pacearchaeota archaeon]|nr:hypothetical protein [Candidatus Pacearchaeota archaeon]
MNKKPELTFEEFKQRCNNFHCHFVDGECNTYRQQPYFIKFQKTNSELEKRLTRNFTLAWRNEKSSFETTIKRFYERLYEAYKIMRVYVETDVIMFR